MIPLLTLLFKMHSFIYSLKKYLLRNQQCTGYWKYLKEHTKHSPCPPRTYTLKGAMTSIQESILSSLFYIFSRCTRKCAVVTVLYSPHCVQGALFYLLESFQLPNIFYMLSFFIEWLKTTETYSLTVVEARCPKSMCHQSYTSSEGLGKIFLCFFLASSQWPAVSASTFMWPISPSMSLHDIFSPMSLFSYNTSDIGEHILVMIAL